MQRIEICGTISSGKTTILECIDSNKRTKIFENFSNVPCLQDFYSDIEAFSFETEFFFTLQHYYQIKKTLVCKNDFIISDFSLAQDYAYAKTTLKPNEFECYQKMHRIIMEKIGYPNMVFLLKASPEILMTRIMERARDNENSITSDYLSETESNLVDAINEIYQGIPIFFIDTEKNSVDTCKKHIETIIKAKCNE